MTNNAATSTTTAGAAPNNAYATPAERGEDYVALMRDYVEANNDQVLQLHHDLELARLIRPLSTMNSADLNLVLEGIHYTLLDVLDDLITARNRAQHNLTRTPTT